MDRKRLARLLAFTCLIVTYAAAADDYPNIGRDYWDDTAEWYRQCLRVKDIEPPVEDRLPGIASGGAAECDTSDLYYRTLDDPRAQSEDWLQVRRCALGAGDTGTLMMLYANGFGVARNSALALKYACSTFGAKNEMERRALYFANRDRDHAAESGRLFDICDHASSGLGAGECARIESERAAIRRQAAIEYVAQGWTRPQQDAFQDAYASLRTFADVYVRDGRDYVGSAAAAFAIAAKERELDLFLANIEEFERGVLPAVDRASSQSAERTLDDLFQMLVKPENFSESGWLGRSTVTLKGLQDTQTAWLQYRDKWAALGQARYPSVEPSSWMTVITARRIEQLEELKSHIGE